MTRRELSPEVAAAQAAALRELRRLQRGEAFVLDFGEEREEHGRLRAESREELP